MKIGRLERERLRRIRHQHHHLFVCKHEKQYCTRLREYTDGKVLIRLVDVPGNRHTVLLHRALTKLAQGITKELLAWMLGLHLLDLSVNGQFTSDHLYVSTSGHVKIDSSLVECIKPLTPGGRRSDRHRVAGIIEAYLLSGTSGKPAVIPHDVRHLLDLLRNGNDEDDFVLARHPGGMTEIEQLGLITELIAQVEGLELRDPEKYERIVNSLPYDGMWPDLVELHDHLSKVYYWRNRQKSYTRRPGSMLLLKRNSLAHLIKLHSIKVRRRRITVNNIVTEERNVDIRFKYHHIAHMFSFAFPQVTPILQLSLHREQELEGLYKNDEE